MSPLTTLITGIGERFDEKFVGYWRGEAIPDELKFHITTELHSILDALGEEVEGKIIEIRSEKRTDEIEAAFDAGAVAANQQTVSLINEAKSAIKK